MLRSTGFFARDKIASGVWSVRLSTPATIVLLPARTIFLLASQAVVAWIFHLFGDQNAWRQSTAWWTVYGTLADLGCLALLVMFAGRPSDLFGPTQLSIRKVLVRGFIYFLAVMPVFLVGALLASYVVYGDIKPHIDAMLLGSRRLPVWAMIYSVTLWWPIWSATEELTYQRFLLDRLRQSSTGVVGAIALVGFWWAAQHSALPYLPDARYLLWRFLSFLPGVLALMLIYLRTRQIRPLIVAHWAMDIVASASTLYWG